jgi:uncharacterized membrane protein
MRKIFFFFCFFLASSSWLYSEYFYIENYNTDIIINRDSSAFVEEKIEVFFTSPRHGIFRYIPIKNENGKLRIKLLNIKISKNNKDFRNINYKKFIRKNNLIFKIGSSYRYFNGKVCYKIVYKVDNFVRDDTVFWHILGRGWKVPIKNVRFSVYFPDLKSLAQLKSHIYIGREGHVAEYENFEKYDNMIEFDGNNINLSPKSFITLKMEFPKGFFIKPDFLKRAFWFASDNWQFAITLITFLICFIIWWYLGKDEKKGVVVVRYNPPKGVTPAEAGAIIDDKIDFKEVTATIFGLAAKGYLKIEKVVAENLGNFFNKKYDSIRFHQIQHAQPELKEHEKIVLDGIFCFGGKESSAGLLAQRFYQTIEAFKDTLYNDITNHDNYFSMNPDEIKKLYYFIAKIVFFIAILIFIGSYASYNLTIKFSLSIFLSSVIIFLFGRIMPQKTFKGAKLYRELAGFREFIKRVDENRLNKMALKDPDIFGKILPYAIALNIEKEWIKKFETMQIKPPQWYANDLSGAGGFSRLMTDLALIHLAISCKPKISISTADVTIPATGGLGGFGGGFGGGGGGSW